MCSPFQCVFKPTLSLFLHFSADSLATRIVDGKASVLVTADCSWRGPKRIHLLEIADHAIKICTEKGHKVTKYFQWTFFLLLLVSHLRLSQALERRTLNCVVDSNISNLKFEVWNFLKRVFQKILNILNVKYLSLVAVIQRHPTMNRVSSSGFFGVTSHETLGNTEGFGVRGFFRLVNYPLLIVGS